MPAAAIPAIIGAGASIYGASQANSQANRAYNLQRQTMQEDQGFRRAQWNDYLKYGKPLLTQLSADAQAPLSEVYGRERGQYLGALDEANRVTDQRLAMSGLGGSGIGEGAIRTAALGRAAGLAGLQGQEKIRQDQLKAQVYGMASGVPGAAQFVSQGNQGMAGLYGAEGARFGEESAMGYAGLASSLNSLGRTLADPVRPTTPTPMAPAPSSAVPVPSTPQPASSAFQPSSGGYGGWMKDNLFTRFGQGFGSLSPAY